MMAVADRNYHRPEEISGARRPGRKISRSEWPTIGTRYAKGESLASIARDYSCTPPAIKYIVNSERKLNEPADPEAQQYDPLPGGRPITASTFVRAPPAIRGDGLDSVRDPFIPNNSPSEPPSVPRKGDFDLSLREAMTLEISGFLVAFDGVVADATPTSYDRLREAADRLLRATARIRIELERSLGPSTRRSKA